MQKIAKANRGQKDRKQEAPRAGSPHDKVSKGSKKFDKQIAERAVHE